MKMSELLRHFKWRMESYGGVQRSLSGLRSVAGASVSV